MRISASAEPTPPFPSPEDLTETLTAALPDFGSVQWRASTGSTNADLIQRLRNLQAENLQHIPARPWLLGAHLQTSGKGRAGRPWANAAGSTLMFSCAFEPKIPLAQLPGISPALGVATCLALRSLLGATHPHNPLETQSPLTALTLKWPNDLQWHGAKLAGLLIETAPSTQVVVGMGLNLSGATALSQVLGREIADLGMIQTQTLPSAAQLVACVARAWQQALKKYAEQGYAAFQEDFDTIDALAGQPVQVVDHGNLLYEGIAQGTDHLGRLRVLTQTGVIPVLVGDVSIRPANTLKTMGAP